MSMNNLSVDGEFRYVVQWFNEWSGLQRDDFIPVLVECLNEDAAPPVLLNGMGNSDSASVRPMSLFQCRIKLFREWTPKWPVELRHKLRDTLFEIDSKICDKIVQNGSKVEEDIVSEEIPNVAAADVMEERQSEGNSGESLANEETEIALNNTIKTSDDELVNEIRGEPEINNLQAQENSNFDTTAVIISEVSAAI